MNYYEELGKINKKIERLQRCKANCGSGGSVELIEATKAQFLTLVSNDTLVFPATYKITDIENGLFVETLSANTFSPDATVSLFVPNYTPSGDNLGQMDFSSIPSVGVDEYVIWGDHYWINNTASPITPTITNDITLAGGLTQIAKASGTIYDVIELECVVNSTLGIGSIFNASNGSGYQIPFIALSFYPDKKYIYCPINNPFIINSDITAIRNHYIPNILQSNFSIKVTEPTRANVASNKGLIYTASIIGNGKLQENINLFANSVFSFITIDGDGEVTGNQILSQNSILSSFYCNDTCKINDNIVNVVNTDPTTRLGFRDIITAENDEFIGNEIVATDTQVMSIHLNGSSKFNNNKFYGDNATHQCIDLQNSEIIDNTINTDGKEWKNIWLVSSKIRNATDIEIQNCTIEEIDLDLTGFATDIKGETIHGGKGWFAITRDFGATPLVDGVPELHNIIPIGGYITNIKAKGSITSGTSLTIGLETDDASLISQVVANYAAGQTYNGISAAATANRSLRLVSVGDLNAGSVTILVEFMI